MQIQTKTTQDTIKIFIEHFGYDVEQLQAMDSRDKAIFAAKISPIIHDHLKRLYDFTPMFNFERQQLKDKLKTILIGRAVLYVLNAKEAR